MANNCACSRGREAAFSLLLADANHCYSIENNGGSGGHRSAALFTQRLCITLRCSFANLLHFFVHPNPSSFVIKLHQWVNSNSMSAPQLNNAGRYTWWRWDLFFPSVCLLRYPHVNLNMYWPTVYNHMDLFLKCCDWRPEPPHILESDKDTFSALNYIIYISKKWMLSHSLTCGEDAVSLGESSLKSRSEGLIVLSVFKFSFFQTVTRATQQWKEHMASQRFFDVFLGRNMTKNQ